MGFLQSPTPAKKLARQYGVKGLFSPELVPSLQPVVLIDDLTGGISNEPQRICTAFGRETGVAAEFTIFRLETPPNTVAQILSFNMRPQSSTQIKVHFGSSVVAGATVYASQYTDGRLRSKGETPSCVLSSDTYAVGLAAQSYEFAGQSGTNLFFDQDVDWIFGNNDGISFDFIEIAAAAADQDCSLSIRWREFPVEQVR